VTRRPGVSGGLRTIGDPAIRNQPETCLAGYASFIRQKDD
jgi:hypothetical protein